MREQGIEVEGLNFSTGFCFTDHHRAMNSDRHKLRNEALRARRRRVSRRRRETLGALSFTPPKLVDEAGRVEAERIRHAVAELTPEQREVVYLKIWEELTFAQIGTVLGISRHPAASRYRYGIDHLGKKLGRTGVGNGHARSRAD